MKKIGSFVLMAVMLLVSANSWAGQTRTAGNATEFKNQWQAAGDGDVIQLTNDITIDQILWLGTAKMNDTPKSITLDLNGWVLQNTSATLKYMFFISHGELNVITSQPGGKIIQNGAKNEELFRLVGSTYKDVNPKTAESGYFTRLFIDEGVKVRAEVKNAIVLDQLGATAWPLTSTNAISTAGVSLISGSTSPYNTSVFGSSTGTANGVRVDVKGSIYGKKYAFKANGNIGGPANNTKADLTGYYSNKAHTVQYAKAAGDENYSPFIRIYGSADLRVPATSDASKKPVAVYCSGYSRWLIEGTCVGGTGVYVKSGDVDINDATIESNYTGDYQAVEPTKSGVTGAGSAIVVESNAAYPGSIDVTVSGDTHVSATNGYAIEENVTSADNTKVDAITINGGTFEGGTVPDPENPSKTTQGTITITGETVNNATTIVSITGGEVHGTGENNVNIGGQDLEDYLSDTGADTHITTVDDGKGGTTVVISSGDAPNPKTTVIGAADGSSVMWRNSLGITEDMEETLEGDLTLDELDITQSGYNQTLTIAPGATLTANRVILGPTAKIIVEAGGKFIVVGDQGITANSPANVVLKTSETAQAYFLVKPTVGGNRQPMATVEFESKSVTKSGGYYTKQRFGIPTKGQVTSITTKYNNVDVQTALAKFDYENNKWVDFGWINVDGKEANLDQLSNPFDYYQMQHNTPNKGTIVTIVGNLYGNKSPMLRIRGNFWNGFANSYMAPIDGAQLLEMIPNTVDKAFYLYDMSKDYATWESVTLMNIEDAGGIRPMQPFLIRNSKAAANVTVDYTNAVYNPIVVGGSSAPTRSRALDNITKVKLIVNGDDCADRLIVAEGENFTSDFDNGYDAEKYMNEGANIYVTSDKKMSIFATDEIENTYVGFQTEKGGVYSIEFSNAQGENLELIDLETGSKVMMVEGNMYTFTADANSANDYRFKIARVKEVATDIDAIESQKSGSGIYTIMGQYVGEMNLWSSLPAGVYVVDGAKRVK